MSETINGDKKPSHGPILRSMACLWLAANRRKFSLAPAAALGRNWTSAIGQKLSSPFKLMNGEATDFAAETTARQFFNQARAIASLAYASEGNFPMSVVEAVYEAALSTDDPHRVIDSVDAALL